MRTGAAAGLTCLLSSRLPLATAVLSSLLGGQAGPGSGGPLILCTTRVRLHYATVWDTALVQRCRPAGCPACPSKTEKRCRSQQETVYTQECSSGTGQACNT